MAGVGGSSRGSGWRPARQTTAVAAISLQIAPGAAR